ncbi:MAG: DUF104 domain-containing protein [Clostridium sp.]|jgi:predicted DNA-binding antitoxin AbrB/MazE fold protein|nr:DUF104 domain-containing protein [Clostridium sp.]
MQACKAYYQDGRFIPLELLNIPDGSEAIIAILDAPPKDTNRQKVDSLHRIFETMRNSDEPTPEFERVHFREVEV